MQRVCPREVITINGAKFAVPYKLEVGQSIFLPSLDFRKTAQAVSKHYKKYGYTMVCDERIELGILGTRAWRAA